MSKANLTSQSLFSILHFRTFACTGYVIAWKYRADEMFSSNPFEINKSNI